MAVNSVGIARIYVCAYVCVRVRVSMRVCVCVCVSAVGGGVAIMEWVVRSGRAEPVSPA